MALNPKLQAAIDAARERTRQLMEKAKAVEPPPELALPSSLAIADKKLHEAIAASPTLMKMGMDKFDPYEIENVGRANEMQSLAIDLFGLKGESGCLIGPAGTGKTTTMRAIIRAMILSGRVPILSESLAHKYLQGGLPGIYGGSFTRIATRNLRNNCPPDIQPNIHTIHRLLEFEPEMFSVSDPKSGKEKNVRLFKPTRNKFRTLPKELITYLIDETSMVGMRLHGQFIDAIHPGIKPQIIYIGDIAQIPPVMDDSILGYKMLEFLSTGHLVELKEVYRHAGAIVNLANHIRVGNTIPDNRAVIPYLGNLRKLPKKLVDEHIAKWNKEEDGSKVTIHLWKNRLEGDTGQIKAIKNLGAYEKVFNKQTGETAEHKGFFIRELDAGNYNPMTDMILIPYNKAVGSIELNKHIAHYIAVRDQKEVFEVVAGYEKHYFAVGDKIFHEREEAIITAIKINALYTGRAYQKEAVTLDRWGHNSAGMAERVEGQPIDDIEMLLNIDIGNEDEERKNQASHVLHIKKIVDLDDPKIGADTVSTAAEVNSIIFGYALTIHKSQGSQWPKVYCVFHNSHNRNLQRELLYTAITRAQRELYVICEPETFIQGVISQHIVGNTLEEKARFFIAKAEEMKKRKDLFDNGEKE